MADVRKMREVLDGHEDLYAEALRLFEEEMDEIKAPVAAYRKALERAIAKMNEMLEAAGVDGDPG